MHSLTLVVKIGESFISLVNSVRKYSTFTEQLLSMVLKLSILPRVRVIVTGNMFSNFRAKWTKIEFH